MVFFGTPTFAVTVLQELEAKGILPDLIVTTPDKPQGRGLKLSPSPVKVWAQEKNIPFIQPESFKEEIPPELQSAELFVVAAYGYILPEKLLALPTQKVLNVHPSLLPKYRGAAPIESQILADDRNVGVTIMEMDKEMDHGPIVQAQELSLPSWPIRSNELSDLLAAAGGSLLGDIIPKWMSTEVEVYPQDHNKATFTRKIQKSDGLISLDDDPYQNYLKFCAYYEWPKVFFYAQKNGTPVRVTIHAATYNDGVFTPTRVVPAGKKEMSYEDFLRGGYLPTQPPQE